MMKGRFPLAAALPPALVGLTLLAADPAFAQRSPTTTAALPASGRIEILGLRIGAHADRTRVVLDMSSPVAAPKAQLSSDKLTVTVPLPGVAWKTAAQRKFTQAGPLTDYRFTSQGYGGDRLEISAKQPVQILAIRLLPPDKDKTGHRLILDIAANPSQAAPPQAAPPQAAAPTNDSPNSDRDENAQENSDSSSQNENDEKDKKEAEDRASSALAETAERPEAERSEAERSESENVEQTRSAPQAAAAPPPPQQPQSNAARPSFLGALTRPATPTAPNPAASKQTPPKQAAPAGQNLSALSTFRPLSPAEAAEASAPSTAAPPPNKDKAPAAPSPPPLGAKAREAEPFIARAKAALEQQPPAFDTAYDFFRQAADAGHPVGAFGVAQMYRLGLGRAINMRLAAFWYNEAARGGHDSSQYNLGLMKLRGIGVERNRMEGLELVRAAAHQGNRYAQNLLEKIEANGVMAIDRISE